MRTLAVRGLSERRLGSGGPVSYIDGVAGNLAGGGSLGLTLSATPNEGDLLVVVALTRNAVLNSLAGWAEVELVDLGSDEFRGVWWKRSDGTETTTTVVSGTGSTTTTGVCGIYARFSGGVPARYVAQFDMGGPRGNTADTGWSYFDDTNHMLMCVWGTNFDSTGSYTGVPGSMTEIDRNNTSSAGLRIIGAVEPGGVGTRVVSQSGMNEWTNGLAIVLRSL